MSNQKDKLFFHASPKPDACKHDFQGWEVLKDDEFGLPTKLPLREWLELGQALVDRSNLLPRYFTKWQTEKIVIEGNIIVKADGKSYAAGTYELKNDIE